MKFVYNLCVVVLFLACCTNSADQAHDAAVPPTKVDAGGACQNLNILMVSNASTGIRAILTSTKDSLPIDFIIADHYLPPECQVNNHLCSVLHFGHPDGTFHYIIPSIHGFVVLSLWDNQTDKLPWKSFINVIENCNPTKAFLTGHNHMIVACMNLQSRSEGILYIVNFNLLPNSTGSGWTVVRNADLPTRSETIYSPVTVSEIIHVREQVRCLQRDNLYFVDDAYVLRFPTSGTSDPEFVVSDFKLQNCTGYQSFEYYRGNDSLIIRCSNNRTALYDSCATGHFTYAPDDHIPYPCTNWSTVAYRNGTQLMLNRDRATKQLPSSDINYGKCVQGVNRPTFIGSSADGSIFIAPFNGSDVTNISNGSGTTYYRPLFAENEQVLGVFNESTSIFSIIDLAAKCEQPVRHPIQIPEHFVPDLVTLSPGVGTYECGCETAMIQNSKEQALYHWILPLTICVSLLALIGSIMVALVCCCYYQRKFRKRLCLSLCKCGGPDSVTTPLQPSDDGRVYVHVTTPLPHCSTAYDKKTVCATFGKRTGDNDLSADIQGKMTEMRENTR